jgi:hypothetical protein
MGNIKSLKSTGQVFKETLHLYGLLFNKLMPASFLLAILLAGLQYVFLGSAAGQNKGSLLITIGTLCTALLGFLFSGVFFLMVDHHPAMRLNDAFKDCARIIEKIFFVTIMVGLMITIGTSLFILPGIYLYFALLFVMPVLVLENDSVMEAIQGSFKLIKGKWWYVARSYFVIMFVPFFPVLVIILFSHWFMPTIIDQLIYIALKALVFPYHILVVYVLYKELSV